jgi:hypothetical protein
MMHTVRLLVVGVAIFSARPVNAIDLGHTTGVMWEHLEWQVQNPTYSGNPYDVLATVTFSHGSSSTTHTTEMFYLGSNTWSFRFTGTKPGNWTFNTSSNGPQGDPDLHNLTGSVTINPNPDSTITGFLTSANNKFAVQTGTTGELKAFLFNVFQHQDTDANGARIRDAGILSVDENFMNTYLAEARANGFNVVFFLVMDPLVWTDGTNPRLETFDKVDLLVTTAHRQGQRVHFWLWGDAARGYTPPGGKMSDKDKRLLRYIAARMAPLPGWTMGYGFDLQEWTTEEDTRVWAEYLHDHMGWRHLLWARGRSNAELDVIAYSGNGHSYSDAVSNLDNDTNRPHHFAERDYYPSRVNETWTRRHMWRYTMAGGHGGHWGYKGDADIGNWTYPNSEELRTHFTFWHTKGRFLLDMERADQLIPGGFCLKTPDNMNYVFFAEKTSQIDYDISSMSGSHRVIIVDVKSSYTEIDLGVQPPGSYTYAAPYSSDWAIAVGDFVEASTAPVRPEPPTGLRVE